MDDLENTFPEEIAVIRRLRRSDPVLDEICRDFELLSRELARLATLKDRPGNDHVSDIRQSLAGLVSEIRSQIPPETQRPNDDTPGDQSP